METRELLSESELANIKRFARVSGGHESADAVHKACNEAARGHRYCLYVKEQTAQDEMSCQHPKGGVQRPTQHVECMRPGRNDECNGVKTALHDTCENNECVVKYERIVDVGIVMADDFGGKNLCTHQSMTNKGSHAAAGWTQVDIDGDPVFEEDKGEIRGSTSEKKVRLCVKTTDEAVDDHKDETWGVCNVMVSRGVPCRGDWKPLVVGGEGAGDPASCTQNDDSGVCKANVGWGESASSHIFLCYNKQGCEGRGRDGAHKAIAQMAMTRDKGHGAPHTLPGSQKVWQEGNDVSGDLNQGMWSGGDVYLFQKRAR